MLENSMPLCHTNLSLETGVDVMGKNSSTVKMRRKDARNKKKKRDQQKAEETARARRS